MTQTVGLQLMHTSSTLGEVNATDSASFGWSSSAAPEHLWEAMTGNIQGYIKVSLNEGFCCTKTAALAGLLLYDCLQGCYMCCFHGCCYSAQLRLRFQGCYSA